MPRSRFFVLALVVVVSVLSVAAQEGGQPYIVVFKASVPNVPAVALEHARNFGVIPNYVYQHALKGYAAVIPPARLALIKADPRVDFISEDRPVYAVARRPAPQPPQTVPTGVERIGGPKAPAAPWSIAVAVIDTGSGPHPDLNIAGGYNCQKGRSYDDGNGHGTHVAGTIGAIDNEIGVIGVAPGVPIYSVRVLDNSGSGSWSSVVCGIDWVTQHTTTNNIKVANMSLSGAGSDDGNCGHSNDDALHTAICNSVNAGVTYAVAASNEGVNFSGSVPAAYNEVITVTAIADFDGLPGGLGQPTCRSDVDDTTANFSNFTVPGSSDAGHTIAAPGVCIYSTWKGGGYNTISGTSMASPHVAGAAALCIAMGRCGDATPAAVKNALFNNAVLQGSDDGFAIDSGTTRYYGNLLYIGNW